MLTTPYCFNPDEAAAMAKAGADILDSAHGPDDEGIDRRNDGADARRIGAARCRRCTTPRKR